jgi:uncharacterized protein
MRPRQAYRIDSDWVEYRDYPGVGTKHPRDVPRGRDNNRQRPAAGPLANLHPAAAALKNFYGFPAVLDIDRYRIDGELRDYIVAARELSPNSLTGNQTD